MSRWFGRLWKFLKSGDGRAVVFASLGGALALGLLPDLVQAVPGVGSSVWWMVLCLVVGVLVLAFFSDALRHREGAGIVLYMPQGPGADRSRLELMKADARRKHSTCFTVDVEGMLRGVTVADRTELAFRVMQARLAEETEGQGAPQSVSFYITARLPEAYRLGQLLKFQLHDTVDVYAESAEPDGRAPAEEPPTQAHAHVREPVATLATIRAQLMGLSEERGKSVFPAVGLDSRLKAVPDANDQTELREVLTRDPAAEPEWRQFEDGIESDSEDSARVQRIALVLRVSDNATMVEDAVKAARTGVGADPRRGGGYVFPEGTTPAENRCLGALVIDTRSGNIPDRAAAYEALIRYVAHHWKCKLDEWSGRSSRPGPVRGVLFTDAPATIVLALGAVIGRQTELVPYVPPVRTPLPQQTRTTGATA
ncbi:hypothetical protein ABT009_30285 [Streptomyces sp. NPDC002896]|uniref:hypothetical protein n=1 Tax=Streptomyces sp. NPDC002896 TaxID=3154438 RepID=UPI0033238EC4